MVKRRRRRRDGILRRSTKPRVAARCIVGLVRGRLHEDVLVSAVIKAKNEAHQIGDCIRSLDGFADEVVVVDDGSDDETSEIARNHGARVVSARSEGGYINVLDRIGFDAAHGSWVLRIDADERMTPDLARRLREIAEDGLVNGVRIARRNLMFGGWARYGGWFQADLLKFFRVEAWNRASCEWEHDLHAHPEIRGATLTLPARPELALTHYDYATVDQFVHRTLGRYARTEAHRRLMRGDRFSLVRLLYAPTRRFLGRYFVRRGYRDGTRGFVLALLLALYDMMIELNLWDLGRGDRNM